MLPEPTPHRVPARALAALVLISCATHATAQSASRVARAATPSVATVAVALRPHLTPLADSLSAWRAIGLAVRQARVIGLGEATHGQHEVFEFKRRLTMALIRSHGVRVVAYEASASQARRLDAFIRSESQEGDSSLTRAMRGFGMLIWQIDENAALLRDLRAWNRAAPPGNQVRLIGVDAQDGDAVADRLAALLSATNEPLVARIRELQREAASATQQLFAGHRAAFDSLTRRADTLRADLVAVASSHVDGVELRVRALELHAFLTMWSSPGGRDRAMADLLLAQLASTDRAVLWAHNAHVQRGPLTYLQSPELATGGHLAAQLGERYYAIGVAFGAGGFQANAADSAGRWGFRRYTHETPPRGFLESTFLASRPVDAFVDLRPISATSTLGQWLRAPHPFRWWGGYQVPDDPEAAVRARGASTMTPAVDFDGLAFFSRTTPAVPFDKARLIPAPRP